VGFVRWTRIGRSRDVEIDNGSGRFPARPVDNLVRRAIGVAVPPGRSAIVAELRFLVEYAASIAVVVVPFVILIRRVSTQDGIDIGDLVRPAVRTLSGPSPVEEDPAPRWRPERIRPWSPDAQAGVVPRTVDPITEPGRWIGRGERHCPATTDLRSRCASPSRPSLAGGYGARDSSG
jgi:hypothetical protein